MICILCRQRHRRVDYTNHLGALWRGNHNVLVSLSIFWQEFVWGREEWAGGWEGRKYVRNKKEENERDRWGRKVRASDCKRRERGGDPWKVQGLRLSQPRLARIESWVNKILTWTVFASVLTDFSLSLDFSLMSLTSLEGKMGEKGDTTNVLMLISGTECLPRVSPTGGETRRQSWCYSIPIRSPILLSIFRKFW